MRDTLFFLGGWIGGFVFGCLLSVIDELNYYLREKRRKKKDEDKK